MNIKYLWLCFLTLGWLISACKTETPIPDPVMTASIDGAAWTAGTYNNTLEKFTDAIGPGKRLSLSTTGSDQIGIILLLADYATGQTGDCVGVRTYAFNGSTDDALFTYSEDGRVTYFPDSGTLTISQCSESDLRVNGTFEFVVINSLIPDTIRITEGQFSNLAYTPL